MTQQRHVGEFHALRMIPSWAARRRRRGCFGGDSLHWAMLRRLELAQLATLAPFFWSMAGFTVHPVGGGFLCGGERSPYRAELVGDGSCWPLDKSTSPDVDLGRTHTYASERFSPHRRYAVVDVPGLRVRSCQSATRGRSFTPSGWSMGRWLFSASRFTGRIIGGVLQARRLRNA